MIPRDEDRRRHKRYKVENSVSISSDGVFQVTDISRGGLCFRCPPFTSISDFWDSDILTPIEQLKTFSAKLVWFFMSEDSSYSVSPMIVGAKFRKLSKKQSLLLSNLIEAASRQGFSEK